MAGESDGGAAEINREFWGYGVGAIVAAWAVSHVAAFGRPEIWAFVGLLASTTVFAVHRHYAPSTPDRLRLAMAVAAGLSAAGTMLLGAYAVAVAVDASESLQRRCLVIEREMMRGQPRRADLPDVFQALGCRPQLDEAPRRPAELP